MSGPIVRKYGFPNFEKIFGERPLEHGADDETNTPGASPANGPKDADQGTGLPPDLADPSEAQDPSQIAPPTEFGNDVE